MNFRLFSILFTLIISLLFFSVGTVMLLYINAEPNYASNNANNTGDLGNGILGALTEPFKSSLDSLKIENQNINILLLGGDFVGCNTDTIIVVNINPLQRKVKFLSIPRDTCVEIYNTKYKINAAYGMGGARLACSTIENAFGVKIHYYIYLNTETFRYVVDTLGGVEYDVPEDMDYEDPGQGLYIHLKKGLQLLDGVQSEGIMRFRQYNSGKVTENYDGSDILRIKNQHKFIKSFIEQKSNIYSMTKFKNVLEIVLKNMDTNLNMNDILKLLSFSSNFAIEDIKMITVPGIAEEAGNFYYLLDFEETKKLLQQEAFVMVEN